MTWPLRFSVRHPWWVVGACLAVALAAAALVPRIALRLDARSLIPQGHPSMAEGDRAAERFHLHDVVVIALSDPERGIYTPAALGLLATLSAELGGVPGIVPESVVSLATVPRLFIEEDVIDLRPLLDRTPSPDGETAGRVRREAAALGLDEGILLSPDGKAAAIYAEVERDADRSDLGRRVRALIARHQGEGADLHFSGTAMAQAVLGEAAARDLVRLVPIVLAVLFLVMMLAFRHAVAALVSLAEVGVSLVCTAGLMGLFDRPVFVTTLVLPVILMVIGVTDDIYALNRYFAAARQSPERPVRELVESSFAAVAKPIALTAATTVTGLLALALTPLEPQRIFGFYGAVAVAISTLLTFSLLPALLVLLAPRADPARGSFARRLEEVLARLAGAFQRARPGRVAAAVAAVAACALALVALRLRIEDNWIGNLPPSSSTVRGDRAINRLLAGTNTLELMLDSGRPRGFMEPGAMAALGAVEDALAAHPGVGAVESAFGDVVRVNAALAGEGYRPYRETLRRGGQGLGRAEIEQALLLLASAGRAPGLERLDPEYRRARMTVFVRSANYSRMESVLARAGEAVRSRFGAGASPTPFGDGWTGHQAIRLLVVGQIVSISFAVLANLALLVGLFRSLSIALVATAPVVFSILCVFGVLAAAGVPLGTANSMFAAIALGIGIDYSIHLVASFRAKLSLALSPREALAAAMGETGPAILTSALVIVAGFAVLAFSEVPPNRQLGLLVCLSLAVGAMATLVLVPVLLLLRFAVPQPRSQPRKKPRRSMSRRALTIFFLVLLLAPPPWRAAAAEPPSKTTAEPPPGTTAQPPPRPAAEPPSRPAAGPPSRTAAETPPQSAAEIVEAYNGRDFGSPGWRRIFLELKSGTTVTRTFTILHLFEREGDEVRSLVLLEEPVNLRGTSYLLTESLRGGAAGMQVNLFLPAGKRRVLTVKPSRFDEGLLGSDFSYSDLRWAIPSSEYRLALGGTTRLAGRTAWVVEARPARPANAAASSWSRIRYFVAREPARNQIFLLGADYYRGAERRPAKWLRVEESRQIAGVWTPVRMVMRLPRGRSSVLTLQEAGFGAGRFHPDLFVAESLPLHGDRLKAGQPVVDLASGVRP